MAVRYRSPLLTVEEVPVPDGAGGTRPFVRLHLRDWVAVAAVTDDDRWVLVEQHRFGSDRPSLEPVGGVIDGGETPEDTARRELGEETGYGCAALVPLGVVRPNPTLQTNRCFLFLARGAAPNGPPRPDPTERLAVRVVDRATVTAHLADGRIDAALAVLALERALRCG